MKNAPAVEERYVGVAYMAAKYDVSKDVIYDLVSSGAWPAGRVKKSIRFSPAQQDEIDVIVLKGRQKTYRSNRLRDLLDRKSA